MRKEPTKSQKERNRPGGWLRKELWSERVADGLLCIGLSFLPLAMGAIVLLAGNRDRGGTFLIGSGSVAFGLASLVAGIAVIRRQYWGWPLACCCWVGAALVSVLLGNWIVAVANAAAAAYFFMRWREGSSAKIRKRTAK